MPGLHERESRSTFMRRLGTTGAAWNTPHRSRIRALGAVLVLCALVGSVLAQEAPKAWLIKLEGVINSAYAETVKRKIEQARSEGAGLIILELDTPGGTVEASQNLGDFIFTQDGVRIVAYINTEAFSGGTMVALACNEIYIDAALGKMGDVEPIMPTGQELGEKFQAAIRETMDNYAERRGYPIALVDAMVTKELEVFRVKFADDPKEQYVTGQTLENMPEAQRQKIVGQPTLIVREGELLTMSAREAVEYGFARKAVTSREALYDELAGPGATLTVERMYLTASERLLTVLDTFSPLLIVAGLILLWVEITHPGFGAPGILGIACFVTFFMVKYSLHYAHMLEILLFAAGLVLLVVEVLLIPGFGLVGVLGIGLLFVSIVLMFQQFTIPRTPSESIAFGGNILTVFASFLVALVGMAVVVRYVGSIPVLSRIVRRETLEGATVGARLKPGEPDLRQLVGQSGVALTPLHPAGHVEFGDRLVDVVTEGEFIEKGTQVEAVAVHGRQVIVKAQRET